MRFTLTRRYWPRGTTGRLFGPDGAQRCCTIERAKDDPDHPCVPEGVYTCVRYASPKHGPNTWALVNAALGVTLDGANGTRSYVEIHSANWPHELEGCVSLCETAHGPVSLCSEPYGDASLAALVRFMSATMNETEIELEITSEEARN